MSAYIMDDREIAKLAASLEYEIVHGHMTGRLYRHRHDEMVSLVQSITEEQDRIDTISFHLLRINTLSVNARYKQETPIRYNIDGFRANRVLDRQELFRLISCWTYQSCEAEYCTGSQVYRLMEDWEADIAISEMHKRMSRCHETED